MRMEVRQENANSTWRVNGRSMRGIKRRIDRKYVKCYKKNNVSVILE